MKISVIIPTLNGLKLLEKNLPSVIISLGDFDSEIIVVDNGSSDETSNFLKEKYPNIRLISLDKNYGFSIACNRGAEKANGNLLLFLNNDVKPEKDFLKPLISDLKDDIFSVSSLQIVPDKQGEHFEGASYGYYEFGIIRFKNMFSKLKEIKKTIEILYPAGGCFLTAKDKFVAIGGFSEIYSPFYWEDVDLGYRAWKRGWISLFEPKSVVCHNHESTAKKISVKYIKKISERNKFLFNWINLTNKQKLLFNLLSIPFRVTLQLFKGNYFSTLGFLMALSKFGQIITIRKENVKYQKMSDNDILERDWFKQDNIYEE
ncbi:MAG: glycosyltransferase [Patescibacteria group bacterium]|jgi:GT2 family glycosyltransferase